LGLSLSGDTHHIMGQYARTSEKLIGRRAFISLVLAGLAALFLGKEILPSLRLGTGGSTPSGSFRINSVAPAPAFERSTWRLTLDGMFRKPMTLTYQDFLALPQVERTRDFYCVEGWGVTGVTWRGVTVRTLMEQGDIDPRATHLVFYSGDEVYDDSLTLEEALRDDTLLAHELNGGPLEADMGLPLRLVLPDNYGYKYVKWVIRVEAIDEPFSGYWEDRGYPADGSIR